ncbi:hypothetical protein FACS189485_10590 [Spirochaetia bacterium]|nr:hypothetical protein FACS189485_10590 [Spirochaetia bacterium]
MEFLEDLNIPGLTCPPEGARPVDMSVYRFVKHNPVEPSDIWSYREEYPGKVFHGKYKCQARACSVFVDHEDVTKLGKMSPFKNMKLVLIYIKEKDGVLLNTPALNGNSHHSWWVSREFTITADNVKEAG